MPTLRQCVRAASVALVLLAAVPATAPAADGPVAAYGFEDAGTAVGDSSGYGHTGSTAGNAARTAAGRFGSAMSFDGNGDLVEIADAGPLNLASRMTLEAWVNPASVSGWRTVLQKGRQGQLSYGLYGGSPTGVWTHPGPMPLGLEAPSPLATNTWTHVAATYDGSTTRLYLDGAEARTGSAGTGPLVPGDGPLTIGGNRTWGEWFSGLIDEVRVYDRVLTAAEIAADMTTPVGAPGGQAAWKPAREIGSWTAPRAWPLVAVHMSMLDDGRLITYDAFGAALNSERIWDPATETFAPVPSGINLFCTGHALLSDGRLFTAGGHFSGYVGLPDTTIFDPTAGTWLSGPKMTRGRWYPTTTTLADGRVLIVSGDAITTGGPDTPFIASSDTLPEVYDPKTNSLKTIPTASRKMPLYPFMFLTPDGRVVDAGPDQTTRILDVGTGLWSTVAERSPIDGHSAVMYRPGRILKTGTWSETEYKSTTRIANGSAVLRLDQTVPDWSSAAPMKWSRTFHTLTVLPDGDVLALGGQAIANGNALRESPVLQPEIWDPDTDTWTPAASHVRPRGYHNTSILLPDGRILLAGSGRLDGSLMIDEKSAEIYSPPYLHKGPRPTIAAAPGEMRYGSTIAVDTPDADRIAKVTLVRTGAVTHAFNMDQRYQELTFRRSGNRLEIDTPTSAGIAPPGIYYVFLVDDAGVPSKAAILRIHPDPAAVGTPDVSPPSVPQGVGASGGVDRVSLAWSASSDDVGVARYVVHRSPSAGFVPSSATRVATVSSGTSYADVGLAAGRYHYRVIAEDAAGNASAPSAEAAATVTGDVTAPTVSVTAPAQGATVRGVVSVSATAADDVAVAGVQFRLDGAALGAEDTTAPYSVSWDSTTATAGAHTLTAVARDAAGNTTTATAVNVTVDNSVPAGPVPVAAYGFEDGAGATAADATGNGHTGAIREATWAAGKHGGALAFDGIDDWVTITDTAALRLTKAMTLEAWVHPTTSGGWRTVIMRERVGELSWALYSSGTSTPSAWIHAGATTSATAPSALTANTWTHLAATYDGTVLRLYVNGTNVRSTNRTGTLTTTAGNIRLGGNSIWGEHFAGRLDDIRIYNSTLTAQQIQTDMNTPVR